MAINYFLYARKSTDVEDKQVRSIEDQLLVLRALAKTEGLTIAEEFIEKQSAKIPGRPVFNEMIQRIQTGEAQGIVCWKLDRQLSALLIQYATLCRKNGRQDCPLC